MPTAGVWILQKDAADNIKVEFQSFYAHSGRWNTEPMTDDNYVLTRFNPFMPTAGVGIILYGPTLKWIEYVSILLCPQRALESD